jgi:hypothetical protein
VKSQPSLANGAHAMPLTQDEFPLPVRQKCWTSDAGTALSHPALQVELEQNAPRCKILKLVAYPSAIPCLSPCIRLYDAFISYLPLNSATLHL